MLEKIRSDIKTSLLSGDRFRVDSLKLAQAALMNAKIAKGAGAELSDEESIAVIQKEIKKRKEAAEMYRGANSLERAENEEKEVSILEEFVPKLLSGVELSNAVDTLLATLPEGTKFPDAMRVAIDTLGNVDKGQLAGLLKTKLS